jgi:lipopolysaccharide transport system ATP-binding protein
MENNILIKAEGVRKKFCRSLKRSMFYGISDISKDILGLKTGSQTLRKDEFWSLDDISFEVKRGECLGIIGANGAGKSTLLKMLNGIILPDGGKITMKGKVGALIEVGAGFHPMLSGRENIYINGSILGMSKKEIDDNFNSIVEFAELKDSIDMPVKHYSSGMYVRLGFAIAAHVKPDILILDEVLAVGDIAFVAKCFQHLSSIKKDTAIILVSHDMRNISRICDNALFIEGGKQLYSGSTAKAINCYRREMAPSEKKVDSYNNGIIEFKNIEMNKAVNQFVNAIITLQLYIKEEVKFVANVAIYREDGTHCCGIMSESYEAEESKLIEVKLILNKLSLMPGGYYITVAFWDECKTGLLAVMNNVENFVVIGAEATQGVYMPEHTWEVIQK